jgi:uncharacterized protein (TIGR02466 family)
MENNENHEQFFGTPIFSMEKPEWVEKTNKICQPHLDESHEVAKNKIKKSGTDFGHVYHSSNIQDDPKLKYLVDFMGDTAWNLLDRWGADLSNHTLVYESMWVQEFAKDGGGHHRIHIHENSHISGFYFLENDKASFPLFHDPRQGAAMTALPEKDVANISLQSRMINYQPMPGNIYMFPSYLPHEYVLSRGGKFRFVHFNIQAVSNSIMSNEGSV